MQKQLMDQIQESMKANIDTIALYHEMIQGKNQQIEELSTSLQLLTDMQTEQLPILPQQVQTLTTALNEQSNSYQRAINKLDQATALQERMTEIESKQVSIEKLLTALAQQLKALNL